MSTGASSPGDGRAGKASSGSTSGPPLIAEVLGDALQNGDTILVHQCNMQTRCAAGIAEFIFERFPEADCYSDGEPNKRRQAAGLGSMELVAVGRGGTGGRGGSAHPNSPRYICNLFAQNKPGRADRRETAEDRLKWFQSGLDALLKEMRELDRAQTGETTDPHLEAACEEGGDAAADASGLTDDGKSKPVKKTAAGEPSAEDPHAAAQPQAGTQQPESQRPEQLPQPPAQPASLWRGKTVAFPKNIGCGLAGGDWREYYAAIDRFARKLNQELAATVVIVGLARTCDGCGAKGLDEERDGWWGGKRWYCKTCWDHWR